MIEKLWAKVKGFVAAQDHAKRTPAETREHIIEGLYGSARCEGVTTSDCKRYILHAKGTANSWLHDSKTLISAAHGLQISHMLCNPLCKFQVMLVKRLYTAS